MRLQVICKLMAAKSRVGKTNVKMSNQILKVPWGCFACHECTKNSFFPPWADQLFSVQLNTWGQRSEWGQDRLLSLPPTWPSLKGGCNFVHIYTKVAAAEPSVSQMQHLSSHQWQGLQLTWKVITLKSWNTKIYQRKLDLFTKEHKSKVVAA